MFITLKFIAATDISQHRLDWKDILKALSAEGLKSVMIEGGGDVINSLLVPEYFSVISSVIVTIAPTSLGEGGVVVSPQRRLDDGLTVSPSLPQGLIMWRGSNLRRT
jgi:2,5-diamino-6-(ribosylamino)-4(3H)-pyrimidinone 5'-phosphate reductase